MAEAKIAGCTTTTNIKTQFSHCRASKHLRPLLPSHGNPPPFNERPPPPPLNEIVGMGGPTLPKLNGRCPFGDFPHMCAMSFNHCVWHARVRQASPVALEMTLISADV